MKKLGFGLMRLPQLDPANAASVDVEQVKKMVDRFIEKEIGRASCRERV